MSDLIGKTDLCLVHAMSVEKTLNCGGGNFIFPELITKEQAQEIKEYIAKKTGWSIHYEVTKPFKEENGFVRYKFTIFSPEDKK